MTTKEWKILGVETHGLPSDLFVPIAARDLRAIARHVGTIRHTIAGRKRPTNALVVEAGRPLRNSLVPLWKEANADQYYRRLHPACQLWVHVDYAGYRRAWTRLGFDELGTEVVLDHIRNRVAVRLSGYRHPFLRVCPVSRRTNTSGGLDIGAEGLEKAELQKQQPPHVQRDVERCLGAPVVLADPVDLTKMLDIPPGLSELPGVASMLMKFYASGECQPAATVYTNKAVGRPLTTG